MVVKTLRIHTCDSVPQLSQLLVKNAERCEIVWSILTLFIVGCLYPAGLTKVALTTLWYFVWAQKVALTTLQHLVGASGKGLDNGGWTDQCRPHPTNPPSRSMETQ